MWLCSNRCSLNLQYALWILVVWFDVWLHFEQDVFIYEKLSILAYANLESIHRSRCRPLKIQSAPIIAAPMTRALKLILCR